MTKRALLGHDDDDDNDDADDDDDDDELEKDLSLKLDQ